ncbi:MULTISPECIES: cysteine desulfurase family protein [Pacificibacter]|uniref:cysteine desulfurase family protein n=1 Tax=Pacificibacter TaxID=1042323 RepID=UPI001C0A13AB|nr:MULTISPECIES: cysteine desulfurase family protein [Pacificibacter]MBU2934904.1 cysteine desulfurase [Pacificibacter marinus]MDO6616258.1 cysteine desulfurase family protein [Pacificibacter sp. 1_MG-2023]
MARAPRIYLDYNATAPLCLAAREAMIAAMDVVGNPSSVHGEGRLAKGLIEKARGQVSDAFGASSADIVFTSGATEAAALALAGRAMHCADVEHEAVSSWCETDLAVDANGAVTCTNRTETALQLANSESGIVQNLPEGLAVVDATQGFGKLPIAFNWLGCDMALISAHKIGGPKGIGALVLKQGLDVKAQILGGGQEMGRRSGTENLLGIVGFGAAAEASAKLIADGVWDQVATRRDLLQARLEDGADGITCVGKDVKRLPNTLSVITPNWKGETQVMQMDLAGFAVSAGSACSSGKVKSSRVLRAMGYSDLEASCAMRVSLGPETTTDEIERFANAWLNAYDRWKQRAA